MQHPYDYELTDDFREPPTVAPMPVMDALAILYRTYGPETAADLLRVCVPAAFKEAS